MVEKEFIKVIRFKRVYLFNSFKTRLKLVYLFNSFKTRLKLVYL
jgi:hypothetical protein